MAESSDRTGSGVPGRSADGSEGHWFYELVALTSDAVVGVDAAGRVLFANAVAERELGRRAPDLVGRMADAEIPAAQVRRRRAVRGPAGELGTLLVLETQDRRHYDTVALMAAGVGHQLNDMLQTIRGHADGLAARLPATPRAWRDSVESIVETGERAARLVAQMTGAAREERPRARLEDLTDLVTRAGRWLPRVLPPDVTLALECPGPVNAWIDPDHVAAVIEHLARNAGEAMAGGGRLVIGCTPRPDGEGDAELAGKPMLTLEDTGPGMEPAVVERLFEPFFTTRRGGGHLGLGLAIVQELVHRQGGLVEVDSRPGAGTRVRVTFPAGAPHVAEAPASSPVVAAAAAAPEPAPVPPREVGAELRGTETVLVAEDTDGVRDLVVTELKELGYNTLEAARGDEAVDLANGFAGRIDVLISDVMMPGLGGVAVAKALRQTRPDIAIIFLSGYVTLELNERMGRELGAEFVSKPFPFGLLARKVREVLARPAFTAR